MSEKNEWSKKRLKSIKRARAVRHRKLNEIRIALSYAAVGFIGGITPFVISEADRIRGYVAIGGEVFFPCLAMVAYYLIYATIEMLTYWLDEREMENVNNNESLKR